MVRSLCPQSPPSPSGLLSVGSLEDALFRLPCHPHLPTHVALGGNKPICVPGAGWTLCSREAICVPSAPLPLLDRKSTRLNSSHT